MVSLLFIHFFCCAFLTGLIWLIQLVHYPAFKFVNQERFTSFHEFHSRTITFIVAPLMIVELISSVALTWLVGNSFFILNLLFVVALWLLTAFLSVPIHQTLSRGFNSEAAHSLVVTNWPRTLIWSVRSAALLCYCLAVFSLKGDR